MMQTSCNPTPPLPPPRPDSRSLKEEGLFRVPGNQAKIDALLKQVQQGTRRGKNM